MAAWEAWQVKFDRQVGFAATEISLRLEGAAKRMIVGQRPAGEKAISNQPPMNRTGNLRRSIRGTTEREGFGIYSAVVGADMIYARAVEIGEPYNPPSWKDGQRFPFIEPAVRNFISTGLVNRILIKHMGAM